VLRRPVPVLITLLAATAVTSACTGGGSGAPSATTASPALSAVAETSAASAAASSQSPAAPSTTPSPAYVGSLFSGRQGVHDGRVLVVKLDNTPSANPHAGLQDADVVYVEQVEGGLTRYAAVFSTRIPKKIGPVRSARISDFDLLAQYGKVAFAFSGSQTRLKPVIARANLFNVSGDAGPAGYYRDFSRPAPYNFFGNGPELLRRAPHAVHAHDVGFRFSADRPAVGLHVSSATVRWPAARAVFEWSTAAKRWLLTMDGVRSTSDGVRLGGTTVVIQYVSITNSSYHDRHGGVTPFSATVGHGRAVILMDGRAQSARWSRPSASRGTVWTTPAGKRIAFAPGQVWVLLVNQRTPASLTR
jgi:hypothetical protein